MADQPDKAEKTEDPTPKKLEDARKKGDVAKSQEVNAWFAMMGITLVIIMFANSMLSGLSVSLRPFLGEANAVSMDGGHLIVVFREIGYAMIAALSLPFLVLIVMAIAGNVIQHKPLISANPIKPKLNKISPLSGFKRLFSKTSLVNFAKGLAKLAIVSAVMFLIAWPERDRLDQLVSYDSSAILLIVKVMALKLLGGVIAVMTIVAALDYAYQRYTWWEKQKMTPKEVRDEHKQLEGDPHIKAKLRQIRMERGRKRMMANVPNATVIITNPTHYSIALQYEDGMNAPVCLAKGVDAVALRIREVAKENDIPLVENKLLARALHATVEIDEEVPEEHYKAVAEIIGYVMKLKRRIGGARARR